MNVKKFIIENGIEMLKGQAVTQNEKTYKIELSENDLHYHSLKNKDWNNCENPQERLNGYHEQGNYRFYATDENNNCIWVYPSTELEEIKNMETNPELLETLQQIFKRLEAYRQDFLEDTPANEQQREIIIDIETTILGAIRK